MFSYDCYISYQFLTLLRPKDSLPRAISTVQASLIGTERVGKTWKRNADPSKCVYVLGIAAINAYYD